MSRSRDRQRQATGRCVLGRSRRIPVAEFRGLARALATAVLVPVVHEPVSVRHVAAKAFHHGALSELRPQQQRDQQQQRQGRGAAAVQLVRHGAERLPQLLAAAAPTAAPDVRGDRHRADRSHGLDGIQEAHGQAQVFGHRGHHGPSPAKPQKAANPIAAGPRIRVGTAVTSRRPSEPASDQTRALDVQHQQQQQQ